MGLVAGKKLFSIMALGAMIGLLLAPHRRIASVTGDGRGCA